MRRRRFLRTAGLAAAGLPLVGPPPPRAGDERPLLRPPRLRPGDTVALVAPAGAVFEQEALEVAVERVRALGLVPRVGRHVLDRRGYLAGTEADRAADLMRAFTDPDVRAVVALRGGWGCARLLPLLDYDTLRAHPRLFVGYSDVTALHLALYARSRLVSFHGPNGLSTWSTFTVDHFRPLAFEAATPTLRNPAGHPGRLVQTADRTRTITPGTARGPLAGGNLTVLTALMGTPYLPDFAGHLLFLEDVDEDVYRVDRMLTQLALAGVLARLAGVVFGRCTRCDPGEGYGSLTLEEVLADHLAPLGIPAYSGAMIGHIRDKFTLPLGIRAELDADAGTLRLLEPAVR